MAPRTCSDPDATPEPQLDWLAAGSASPSTRRCRGHRREWAQERRTLTRWPRPPRRGLLLALNIATGHACRREIIVIEDFRLRRILSHAAPRRLGDELDPLLPGLVQSGNSIVGDTLVLGDGRSNCSPCFGGTRH